MKFESGTDEAKVIAAFDAAVEEKGRSYVYPQQQAGVNPCTYLEYQEYDVDGTGLEPTGPSCIVGHALLNAGVVDEVTLMDSEGNNAGEVSPFGESHILTRALNSAQHAQDTGMSWGEAFDIFHDLIEKATEVMDEKSAYNE